MNATTSYSQQHCLLPCCPTAPFFHPHRQVFNKSEGQFSPRTAEMRADLGSAATDLATMQTFDGPAPETINGKQGLLNQYLRVND